VENVSDMSLSPFSRDSFRRFNIALLSAFIPATQQDDEHATMMQIVDPISRAEMDAHLANTVAKLFNIARQALCKSVKSRK
jgi:hypothetical protein